MFIKPVRRRRQCRGLWVEIEIMELKMVVEFVDVGKFGLKLRRRLLLKGLELGLNELWWLLLLVVVWEI